MEHTSQQEIQASHATPGARAGQASTVSRQIGTAEPVEERLSLPESASAPNEGKTPAAWTLTWVSAIGVLIAGLGMVLEIPLALWGGVGITALGLVLGGVLRAAGFGQRRPAPASDESA